MAEQPGDPSAASILEGAERELAEDEMALIRALMGVAVAEMPLSETLTKQQMREKLEALIAERPDLHEIAERLAIRQQFRDMDTRDV